LWKWVKGTLTTKADFGDPLASTGYQLCVYDGTSTLVSHAEAPAGGNCNSKRPRPCWKESGTGFKYVDRDLTPDGLQKVQLKAGLDGKAKILVKGKGDLLSLPPMPIQTLPVTVQLINDDGTCWEARYGTTLKNVPEIFKAKGD
jgi:hypothetical protein